MNNMKVLILAGGLGTRLSEETKLIPTPMVEIGGKPILWHIMKIYSFSPFGYEGALVTVEVDLRRGIPAIDLVGSVIHITTKVRADTIPPTRI